MSERLGDAILALRTDDSQFTGGIAKAEGKARALGGTLDKTSASSGKLSTALTTTGKAAATAGNQFQQAGRGVTASAGAQQMGMRQLSMQLSDVATMYALGARPMQIFASQSGQVLQSIQLLSGGTSKFAAFMGGPWGMAIMTGALVLTPFIGKLFETERAMEQVELAADSLGDAQSVLGQIFDLTSGKIKSQNELLILNARLMAINLRAEAQAKRAGARETLINAQRPGAGSATDPRTWFGRAAEGAGAETAEVTRLLNEVGAGRLSRADAILAAESIDFSKTRVTRQQFREAIRDVVIADTNEQMADLISQSLESGELAPELRNAGRAKADGKPKRDSGPSAEEIERRYESDLVGYTQAILSARQQTATSAEERAEFEARAVEWARREALADIEANEDYSKEQKAELKAAATRRADAELEVIEFRKRRELEQQAQALADEQHRGAMEALQLQLGLAETEADRKRIALQIFDAEQAYLRSKLDAVILSETANDEEKRRAQAARDALDANAAAGRAGVARANETEVERYLRDLNKTPEQINEAIGRIEIDGLEALNDGLVDAIMGAKSLGDVFHDVANQIIADLLRIMIQKAVIEPLANALFAGLGAGGGSGGGALFAGMFASGGMIPPGQFGIVGERGPEAVIGTSGGARVLPNSALRGMGRPGSIHVTVSGARGNAEIEAMVQAGVRSGIAGYDQVAGERVQNHFMRRG